MSRRPGARALTWGLGLGIGLALHQAASSAGAEARRPGGYLGAAACGGCHPDAFTAWRASRHARAADPLSAAERNRRACQACHATGDAPSSPAAAFEVGCEACHGAGADYAAADVMADPALARALGLRPLDTAARRGALCLECHRADREPFSLDAAWRRIAH